MAWVSHGSVTTTEKDTVVVNVCGVLSLLSVMVVVITTGENEPTDAFLLLCTEIEADWFT